MKKYIIIKLMFGEEIHPDVHDLMLDEYEKASQDLNDYAASLGAEMFVEDTVNAHGVGRSYVSIEHNFPMTRDEKEVLIRHVSRFFEDGETEKVGRRIELRTFNVLSAVRFLQTEGELFEL